MKPHGYVARSSSWLILAALLLGNLSVGHAQTFNCHVTNNFQSGDGSLSHGVDFLNGGFTDLTFDSGIGDIVLSSRLTTISAVIPVGSTTLTGTGNTVTALGGFPWTTFPVFTISSPTSVAFNNFTVQGSSGSNDDGYRTGGSAVSLEGAANTFNIGSGTILRGGGSVGGNTGASAIVNSTGVTTNTITNSGTIEGGAATSSGVAGAGMNLSGTANTITNETGGSILGGTPDRVGGGGVVVSKGGSINTVLNNGTIQATGGVAGIAISGDGSANSFTNNGTLLGGTGHGDNTNGGNGIEITGTGTTSTFSNTGTIQGGDSISSRVGGTGVVAPGSGDSLINFSTATVQGGTGSSGANGTSFEFASPGGTGGGGVNFSGTNSSVTNAGIIRSGTGGTGGAGGYGGFTIGRGGDGGGSNEAVLLSGNQSSVSNTGTIQGGDGGIGGRAHPNSKEPGGTGGVGGTAISLSGAGSSIANEGTIQAGAGGMGGNIEITLPASAGTGGNGGTGIAISGSNTRVTNNGTIQGGTYGRGGIGALYDSGGIDGTGGIGILFTAGSGTIINEGTISGGSNNNGYADAIHFSGTNNLLELHSTSIIHGNAVFSNGNANNVLALGGTTDGTFDTSLFGIQYHYFDTFLKSGTSTWTLTGTLNSPGWYTGKTVLSGGILRLGSSGALGTRGTLAFTGGTLQYSAGNTMDYSSRFTSAGSQIYNIDTNGQSVAFASPFTSANATLNKLGAGTLTLNAGSTETRAYILTAGALQLGAGVSLNPASISFNGGTLQFGADGISDYSASFSNAAGQAYSLDTNGHDVTLASSLSSSGGSLTKLGAGTLLLSGDNSFSGGLTIAAGTVEVGQDHAAGSGTITINGGGIRSAGGVRTLANALTLNGNFTVGRATTFTGNATLGADVTVTSINPDSGVSLTTFGGVISGSHGITLTAGVNQISTFVFSGDNTYSGRTTISAGTLRVGAGGTTGTLGTGNVVNNYTLAFNRSNTLTVANQISGTGNLIQQGTGTTILTADNTYEGVTSIIGGRLQVGSGGTTGSLGSGDVGFSSGTLVFNRSNTLTQSSHLIGSGAIEQAGTGTTILTANNSYSQGTTISAGTLQVGAGFDGTTGSLGTGGVTNNGTLIYRRSNTLTDSNVIQGTGNLVQNGTGTTILTGVSTYTGTTTVNSGTLQVDGSIANSATTVNGGARLQGSGVLADVTMSSGSVLMAGHDGALGTLTTGGLSFAENTVLQFKLDSSLGTSDSIMVNGEISFNRTLLVLNDLATGGQVLEEGTVLTLLTYVSGKEGIGSGTDIFTYNGIDLTEGAIFTAGANTFQINYAVGDPMITLTSTAAVPEPGTWALIVGGLVFLVGYHRRNKKRAAGEFSR